MVIQGRWKGQTLTLSLKSNCLTISLARGGAAEVFSFDLAGRMWTALLDGVSYRRGLDGKVIAKWQTAAGGRERRWLMGEDALQVSARARVTIEALWAALQAGEVETDLPLLAGEATAETLARAFERAVAFGPEQSRADEARFAQVYLPVGILPPDQYMAVVLQATEGCAFNTCTFCDFYKDRPFRIKTSTDFKTHAEAVRDFLGEGLSLRRTIFLGDANALVAPMNRLLPLFEAVHQVYDVAALGGIYAFLDGFSAEKKATGDYRVLAELGLKRVYIGLESGNEPLLKFLHKPGKPNDAVRAVRAMKEAGVAVGVIALLGAGGRRYARQHVKDTIRVLNDMHLDLEDIIYFSELITSEGMQYLQEAYREHLAPLSPEERIAQGEAIEAGLKFSQSGGVPHISRYDIREFVY